MVFGLENLQLYIKNHIKLAKKFEELVSQDLRFEDKYALTQSLSTNPEYLKDKVVSPRLFSLVCFRLLPLTNDEECGNKLNRELLEKVNSTGKIFVSHTVLSGRYTLRFAVGALLTEERNVIAAWKVLQDEASAIIESRTN